MIKLLIYIIFKYNPPPIENMRVRNFLEGIYNFMGKNVGLYLLLHSTLESRQLNFIL